MKKLWATLMVSALIVGVLAACGGKNDSNKKELTIGTEATYPPFSYRDTKTNEVVGFDVDVAKEVAKRLDMEPKVVPTEFKDLFNSLGSRFDMIANQIAVKPDREKKYGLSDIYTYSSGKLIVNKDNTDIKELSDLKGKTVGTTQGSNYAVQAEKAGAKLKYYPGIAQVLADLDAHRVDAALNDKLFILNQLKDSKYNVKAVGKDFDPSKIAFTFAKDNKDLKEKVNKALAEMKKDGTLAKISKKYFGADVTREQ
ncbi:extracellular solute-binding protein [Fictibacillus macauensis ZFHKF-1]|uniref:Extracellular solute-binding protein n=1 Tax=Fictibacillus macauensis ZFHKF-1 TaxID=1196324 RepID=I8J2A6_9BACL|nr:transporter substrate-binding domain-containing protein [Fictibacillus macauensis]EIT85876.1 extracellular solute-binding protein [Fictibacillus macauensis ZFHKF-1]